MSAIKQALTKLDDALSYLEVSVDDLAQKKTDALGGGQPDMFPDSTKKKMTSRLDQAIEKVEAILQEA